jgi:hypothetical protein
MHPLASAPVISCGVVLQGNYECQGHVSGKLGVLGGAAEQDPVWVWARSDLQMSFSHNARLWLMNIRFRWAQEWLMNMRFRWAQEIQMDVPTVSC